MDYKKIINKKNNNYIIYLNINKKIVKKLFI